VDEVPVLLRLRARFDLEGGEDRALRAQQAPDFRFESRYGLAGGVWSSSINTAIRVAKAVRTGKMFINSYNSAGIDDMPHGGYKESGIGREWGPNGLEEFQQVKTIQIRLPK